jgi:hypothetical protein
LNRGIFIDIELIVPVHISVLKGREICDYGYESRKRGDEKEPCVRE